MAKTHDNMIFLIDEVFKGTNSVDRLHGAKNLILALGAKGVTGIITTHDLELCNMDELSPHIKNCSFSEYYHNNAIKFDYILKHGRSQSTNAQYLMKMIGLYD